MNQAIKSISIKKYLLEHGFSPKKETSTEAWFSSPIRTGDKDPSFKVDESKNLWYDFGLGSGGSIIDLVMAYQNLSLKDAINHLEQYIGLSFPFTGKLVPKEGTRIIQVCDVKTKSLLNYLTDERKICLEYAAPYLKEAHYLVNKNQYYAIAFKNDLGGYELRNPTYKLSSSPKHITTIPGRLDELNLFEGFMDFFSALTYLKTNRLKYKTIILNSVGNISKLPNLSQIPKINLFLDNDDPGEKAANTISRMNSNITNYSKELYPNYNDFNEMLMSKK
jgi:hypothetical protein